MNPGQAACHGSSQEQFLEAPTDLRGVARDLHSFALATDKNAMFRKVSEQLHLAQGVVSQSPGDDIVGCWLLLVVGCVPKVAGIVC